MSEEWRQVLLRLRPEMLREIDDWRRRQEDLPDRTEAIRRLLVQGLKSKEPGGGK